jgi:hypothetical protein
LSSRNGNVPGERVGGDRRAGQLEGAREPLRHRRQRLLQPAAAQEQPCHLGRQVGLLAPLVGFGRAPARDLGERARDRRGDEEHRQRDPVLPVADRKAPAAGGA